MKKQEEFRTNEVLVKGATALFNSEIWKYICEVLEEEHPARFDSANWTVEQRAMYQARTAGYEKALNVLEELTKPYTPAKHPKPTYEETK